MEKPLSALVHVDQPAGSAADVVLVAARAAGTVVAAATANVDVVLVAGTGVVLVVVSGGLGGAPTSCTSAGPHAPRTARPTRARNLRRLGIAVASGVMNE